MGFPLAATPRIYNLTLTLANTEYSQALTGRVTKLSVQARTAVAVQMAITSGASGTTFITIKSGTSYYENFLFYSGGILYFQSATAGVVVEIIAWSDN